MKIALSWCINLYIYTAIATIFILKIVFFLIVVVNMWFIYNLWLSNYRHSIWFWLEVKIYFSIFTSFFTWSIIFKNNLRIINNLFFTEEALLFGYILFNFITLKNETTKQPSTTNRNTNTDWCYFYPFYLSYSWYKN